MESRLGQFLLLAAFAAILSFGITRADPTIAAESPPKYPTGPVTLVEPFGAGGGPDVMAHLVGQKLSEFWHQPVVVENRPGAGATLGPAMVLKSPHNGYTLLVSTSAHAYGPAILKRLPYDPLKDFIPVAPLTTQPYVLVAGTSAHITTLRELIAAAKARPGQLSFGTTGIGTGTHFGLEKFNLAAGIRTRHVPPRPDEGIQAVVANCVRGQTTFMMAPIDLVLPRIHGGELVALGVSTARRSSLLPNVPTISEAGVPGFDWPIWYGVWAPTGTPPLVVDRLAKDIARALAAPDLRASLAKHGAKAMSMTQPQFARFVAREARDAARIAQAAGIKPQ